MGGHCIYIFLLLFDSVCSWINEVNTHTNLSCTVCNTSVPLSLLYIIYFRFSVSLACCKKHIGWKSGGVMIMQRHCLILKKKHHTYNQSTWFHIVFFFITEKYRRLDELMTKAIVEKQACQNYCNSLEDKVINFNWLVIILCQVVEWESQLLLCSTLNVSMKILSFRGIRGVCYRATRLRI